jgi:hypothetical protein
VGTAVDAAVRFHPMPHNGYTTAFADGGQGMNRTFKTIKGMGVAIHNYLKGFVILVATSITFCHFYFSFIFPRTKFLLVD